MPIPAIAARAGTDLENLGTRRSSFSPLLLPFVRQTHQAPTLPDGRPKLCIGCSEGVCCKDSRFVKEKKPKTVAALLFVLFFGDGGVVGMAIWRRHRPALQGHTEGSNAGMAIWRRHRPALQGHTEGSNAGGETDHGAAALVDFYLHDRGCNTCISRCQGRVSFRFYM